MPDMSRLIACLIALSAVLGLLGQGTASAHRAEGIMTTPGCSHMADMKQTAMHHAMTDGCPMEDCDDCPETGHRGKPCNDASHCVTIAPGSALLLPDLASLGKVPFIGAQQHLASRATELSGLAAPPVIEPPILSA